MLAVTALRKAVRGLLYMSEKDAPFRVFAFDEADVPTKDTIAGLMKSAGPVEELPFAKFFGELTQARKWHAEDDKAVVKRYQDLVDVLREHLRGLKVFKIGEVRVKIVIVGQTPEGRWIGLETDSLET